MVDWELKNVAKMFSSPPCDRKIQPGLTCKGGELAENATKGLSALSRAATTAGAGIAAVRKNITPAAISALVHIRHDSYADYVL